MSMAEPSDMHLRNIDVQMGAITITTSGDTSYFITQEELVEALAKLKENQMKTLLLK